MAGPSVIAAYYGGTGRNQILAQTLASGTETEVKIGNDAGSTSVIAVLSMPTQTAIQGSLTPIDQTMNPAILNAGFNQPGYMFDPTPPFNSGKFDNSKPFCVRVCGTYTPLTGASSVSWQPKIYLGTSKSGTGLVAPSATANTNAAGATYGFLIEAVLFWDSVSQAVRGRYDSNVNGTTPTESGWVTLTANGSSVTGVSSLQFVFSVTWGGSNGGTTNVSEFSISQM